MSREKRERRAPLEIREAGVSAFRGSDTVAGYRDAITAV